MSKQLLDTPFRHSLSLTSLADQAWNYLSETVIQAGWSPITKLSEAAVVASLLRNLSSGHLRILTSSRIYTFPDHSTEEQTGYRAELRVLNDVFWVRLCSMGDLGFSEAYMYGDVECDDLVSLFRVFLDNREELSNMDSRVSFLFQLPQKLTSYRFLNTISNSRSNISAHYDISNDMFAGFLSKDMTYSCAIFDDLDGDLVEAQMRKMRHILKKANIQPGHRVLEIGSGWGAMAILIAQTTLARERIAAVGLEDRISVHLMDYRDMPKHWEGIFDRFISIEMMEAVGAEFLVTYWQKVNWALKKRGGVGVVQVITMPEALFPGSCVPTVTLLLQSMREASKGTLTVDSMTNIGPHYARTLREWRRRFLDKYDDVIIPALKREYPEVMSGSRGQSEIEIFKRKWICDCYCEVGFTTRTLGDHIITFTREGCIDYDCNTFE
ncbi:cyclopropane-fatty-acyl-phospholipid synthase [Dendrothele bispora CBS 962.96]|uniref:Cyclopropane-fatty-acyl-phospholipid synthase n=1 Tax=Dendrothele bispora (strain CBS 962.96) TaxID=1314807 RepID=A0A4S8LEU9_DENBC|nr:cyclopropane-fatty-acyl-phospholipid synthase [Dendrothele bispora CBS 962.96]